MKPILFVGGPKDGLRLPVSGGDPGSPVVFPVPAGSGMYDLAEYRLHRFGGDSRTFFVYGVAGLSAADVLERLIEGYAGRA